MPLSSDIALKTIDGEARTLNDFAGLALLIVNVASQCGFTPQYAGLEALHRRFRERGFRVPSLGLEFGPSRDSHRMLGRVLEFETGLRGEASARCAGGYGKLKGANHLLEWRNWQTHGTQNPATFTGHEGSTPSSSTI